MRSIAAHGRPTLRRTVLASLVVSTALLVWLVVRAHARAQLISPASTALFEDVRGRYLSEGTHGRLGFWPVPEPVPERIAACVIAIEDHRFARHGGVDARGLVRAVWNNLRGRPRQGASTLAMQVIRMQDPRPRTLIAKLEEMIAARIITARHGRDAVLAQYLRLAPQGNRIHGVAYAARRYFQKPPADLSWSEAALLAALPKAPGRFNLYKPIGLARAKRRAGLVLDHLRERGRIDVETHARARALLASLVIPERELRPFNSTHAILRLHEEVVGEVGKPVRTTLDLDIQDRVDALAYATITRLRPRGAGNIAAVVLEREGGAVRAYLGSDFYDDETYAGAIDYARTPRSSGSTLKPFLYALGLERGHFTPDTVLPDLPLRITYPGGQYAARNFDARYLGPMLYRRALANSRNVPALIVLQTCGVTESLAFLRELGLVDARHDAAHYGLGLAIGGAYVTLMDLVGAYAVLANDGLAVVPRWREDAPVEARPRRLISEEAARLVTRFLADPAARLPSFARGGALEQAFPTAVKTGTSNGFRDAWAVAFSRRYVVGVWIGHPDHLEMNGVGGAEAAALVGEIMGFLHPDAMRGIGEEPFPEPRGYRKRMLCPLSGQAATEHCRAPSLELLPASYEPAVNLTHARFAVDRATGAVAGPGLPDDAIAIVERVRLPPIYDGWAARQGFASSPEVGGTPAEIAIASPSAGSRLRLDPDLPARYQTLALRARVTPRVPEVTWYVNGEPFARAAFPYELRWPMRPGTHSFQVRFPDAAITSEPVTVTISP